MADGGAVLVSSITVLCSETNLKVLSVQAVISLIYKGRQRLLGTLAQNNKSRHLVILTQLSYDTAVAKQLPISSWVTWSQCH